MTDGNPPAKVPAKTDEDMIHEVERVIIGGDLRGLQPGQRLWFYNYRCKQVGLDPMTQPFAWLTNKKTGAQSLYLLKEGGAQLRKLYNMSIDITAAAETPDGNYYEVRARATLPDGRHDEDFGGAPIRGLSGDDRTNAKALAFTRAKRRVTISIVGLGILDESEVAGVADMRRLHVDPHTGEVLEPVKGNGEESAVKPVEDTTGAWPAKDEGIPATEAQLKTVWTLWKNHGFNKDDLERFSRLTYDVDSPRALSKHTVEGLIRHLRDTATDALRDSLDRLFMSEAAGEGGEDAPI